MLNCSFIPKMEKARVCGLHGWRVEGFSSWLYISSLYFFLEPMFVDAHVIPDGTDPNDAKVYFFFKEKLTDNSRSTKQIHSMIARICPVSIKVVLIWRVRNLYFINTFSFSKSLSSYFYYLLLPINKILKGYI